MSNTGGQSVVYYDGLCILCSREIEHYRRQRGSESLLFVDITAPDFDAKAEGLDPFLVHKIMHVRTPEGELRTKVDAFIHIWQNLPRYQKVATIADNPTIKKLLNLGYNAFVRIRPYLPRKTRSCEDSPYCETKQTN